MLPLQGAWVRFLLLGGGEEIDKRLDEKFREGFIGTRAAARGNEGVKISNRFPCSLPGGGELVP